MGLLFSYEPQGVVVLKLLFLGEIRNAVQCSIAVASVTAVWEGSADAQAGWSPNTVVTCLPAASSAQLQCSAELLLIETSGAARPHVTWRYPSGTALR